MPRCPRCSGFLQAGAGSCPLCRATFAPLEAGEDEQAHPEPVRDVPVLAEPDVQTTWGRRATEVGFVVGLVVCAGGAIVGWMEDWFPPALEGGAWLLPLLLILVSPLAGMYTGIGFGCVTVASEPFLRAPWRWITGAKGPPAADLGEESRPKVVAGEEQAGSPSEGVRPADRYFGDRHVEQ